MSRRALIVGLAGPALTSAERRFLDRVRPWGVILFARNVVDPEQLRALVSEIGAAVGSAEVPILIDQEGGRVQRLKPPIWAQYPAHAAIAAIHAADAGEGHEAARLLGRLIGADLAELGITVDCDPASISRCPRPMRSSATGRSRATPASWRRSRAPNATG